MATQNQIKGLTEKICKIMNVEYSSLLMSSKSKQSLTKKMCIHFATISLNASCSELALFFKMTTRNVRYCRADIREGIIRESYFSEPYQKIKEGLDL